MSTKAGTPKAEKMEPMSMRPAKNPKARLVERQTEAGPCTVLVAPDGRVPFHVKDDVYIFVPADMARKFNSTEFLAELFARGTL